MEHSRNKFNGVDLVGKVFGRLTVVRKIDGKRSQWLCNCECGNERVLKSYMLLNGIYRSCGCLEKENRMNLAKHTRTHGMTNTILYHKYHDAKERCYNPNYYRYDRYGGRGIKMCEEWKNSFESFMEWAYSAGYDDTKNGYEQTLDRIDFNGDYEPNNCRWVNMKEQSRNRSNTVWIEYHGEKTTLAEFIEKNGITYSGFVTRKLKKGKSLDEILYEWNMKHNANSNYMTIEEASKEYDVSTQTIFKWIKNGVLMAEKCANKYFIPNGQIVQRDQDRDKYGRFLKKDVSG